MAMLNIPPGSKFSLCRNNINTMTAELAIEWSATTVVLDKESGFRGLNRDRLEDNLVAILTAASDTGSIEYFPEGSSFRVCRKLIRRMFTAAYNAIV